MGKVCAVRPADFFGWSAPARHDAAVACETCGSAIGEPQGKATCHRRSRMPPSLLPLLLALPIQAFLSL